jgi:FixJ family two-component response regulator
MSDQARALKIAIVDDEPAVRIGLRRLCGALGVDATAYESGHVFLDSLRAGARLDCVLLDMHMPEMSGLEVQRRMAEFSERVAVIAITADDSPETSIRWIGRGALACLRKPIGVEERLPRFPSGANRGVCTERSRSAVNGMGADPSISPRREPEAGGSGSSRVRPPQSRSARSG